MILKNVLPIVLLLLASLSFADIQVSSYSVSPTTLKPGLSAIVAVTFSNTGATTTSGIVLQPSGSGFVFSSMTVSVGDISPNGSTVVTVPFRVSDDVQPGTRSINMYAYWAGGTVSGPTFKLFSIPVTIENPAILQLSSVKFSKQPLVPGEAFTATATLKNTGGKITDVFVSPASSNFLPQGKTDILVGTLDTGGEALLSYALSTTVSTTPGTYSIPLAVRYTDGLGAQRNATISLGPVEVSKSSIDFSIESVDGRLLVQPGSKIPITLKVTNTGNDLARSAIVSLASASTATCSALFTSLGPNEIFLGDIEVGESKTLSTEIGACISALPGYYPATVQFKYSDASGTQQTLLSKQLGIEVAGMNDVNVIASTSPSTPVPGAPYTLALQVSNVGTGPIRATKASASSPDFVFLGPSEYFIGALDIDDYGTAQYSVIIKPGTPTGKRPINVSIEFRDTANALHSVSKIAFLEVVSADTAAQASKAGGTNGWLLLVLAVVILASAYFAYRKFFKKKPQAR